MTDRQNASTELQRKEQGVEAHSVVFKKELGLTDLALTQVFAATLALGIVGLIGVGKQEAYMRGQYSTRRNVADGHGFNNS